MAALPKSPEFQGVHVAAITPRGARGDVDFGATFEMLDYLSAARVSSIALFTASGEYPSWSVADRCRVTNLAAKRSRVPLTVGVGSSTFDDSLELARAARQSGAAALLVPPPNFFHYDPDDLRHYYSEFADHLGAGIRLFLSEDVDPEVSRELLASGGFDSIEEADCRFVQTRCQGGEVLSAAACAAPELTMALNAAICVRDSERVQRLESIRQELIGWLQRFPQPIGLKAAVAIRGVKSGPLPVPLSPAKQQALEEFRCWFREWLPATRKLAASG